MTTETICRGPGTPGLASVIIPTYNRAYIIRETLDSVLAQTYAPIEVIVIDDGSTDETASVIAEYGDRVRYIRQANAGVAAARNTGFGVARGEFIALVDSDDRWAPWKLALQIAFLRKYPTVGMVWTDMAAVNADGSPAAERYLRTFYKAYQHVRIEDLMTRVDDLGDLCASVPAQYASCGAWTGQIFSQLIRGTLVHTPTTVLRRERVRGTGGYDESLRPTGEDFDFHLRTAVQGDVGFLDVPAIDYRIGSQDQLTSPSYLRDMARIYLKTVRKWVEREGNRITLPASEINAILAYAHQWVGAQELAAGDRAAARTHLWQSIRRVPSGRTAMLTTLAVMPPQVFDFARGLRRRLRGASRPAG